tara:strand:- start:2991 stop:3200 length:210 start_codon:yes stop_codon:yes gene_type:complete
MTKLLFWIFNKNSGDFIFLKGGYSFNLSAVFPLRLSVLQLLTKKSTDMGCGASAPAGGAAVKLHSKIRW